MSLVGRLKGLFNVNQGKPVVVNLDVISNEIMVELKDVIAEFKKLDNKWTWKIWKSYKIYQPLFKQIIELIKEVGDIFGLTNEQKKEIAEIVCWKIIEPLLPAYVKISVGWLIKKGIDIAIEKIYSWLKVGAIESKVFKTGNGNETFVAPSVR